MPILASFQLFIKKTDILYDAPADQSAVGRKRLANKSQQSVALRAGNGGKPSQLFSPDNPAPPVTLNRRKRHSAAVNYVNVTVFAQKLDLLFYFAFFDQVVGVEELQKLTATVLNPGIARR